MRKNKLLSTLLICMIALTGCGQTKDTKEKRDSVLEHIDEKDKKENEDKKTEEIPASDEEEETESSNIDNPQDDEQKQSFGAKELKTNQDYVLKTADMDLNLRLMEQIDSETELSTVAIYLNGTEVNIGNFFCVSGAYTLEKEDGRVFVIISIDHMSDDYVTFLYEITDGTIQYCDELANATIVDGLLNSEKLSFCVLLDALGSYVSNSEYMINENGKFYKEYDMFYFNNEISMDSRFTLTTIKEFPVFYGQLDEILPIGSHICITGTDNVGVITFYNLDTEQSGEIFIEHGVGEDSWMIYIDGCSQFDYFEYIPYAD